MKKCFLNVCAALFALMVLCSVTAHAADNVYAILYDDGTLVFQYGDTPESGKSVKKTYEVDLNAVYNWDSDKQIATTPWYDERKSVKVVNFAEKISPKATAYWFYRCDNLERVDNIQNLDTANVTDMDAMFLHCSGLTALDVSNFDTKNVTNMFDMFGNCSGLTALDVSNFDTKNVTDMYGMFWDCSSLTALDLSNFDTKNVTNMNGMFNGCSGLTVLDVSNFDTKNVTDMSFMFYGCRGLAALDLSHFDTANVTNMTSMFSGCSNLKTIYASDKFTTASVLDNFFQNGRNMFDGCTSLVGGNGTKFDESHTDKEYARIDTASAPGYFTDKDAPAPVPYEITALIPNPYTGILLVKLTNPAAATVFVAYSDTKGQFLTTDMKAVPANAGSVELKLLNVKGVRVSMFDDQYRPLCSPYVSILGA